MLTNRFTAFAVMPILTVAMAGNLAAADPRERSDGSWITISGTAVSPTPSSFTLDYGQGTILVEMDDWDLHPDGYGITDGNRVTVSGRIDDGFFEAKTIEASYVYDQDYNTYFYASAADEEGDFWYTSHSPIVLSTITYYGTVSAVDPGDRSFVIDTGVRKLTVDTNPMYYNPLDDVGYQRIEVGDRVSVSGKIDYNFFTGRELKADSVITTFDASKNQNKQKN